MWRRDPALAILAVAAGLCVQPVWAQDGAPPAGHAQGWEVPALPAVLQEDVLRAPEAAPVPADILSSLDTIETSTMVLEALTRNAEARADLCRLGGPAAAGVCGGAAPLLPASAADAAPPHTGPGPAGPAAAPPAEATSPAPPPPLPRVVEIAGARGMLRARLAMPDGGGMIVRSGTRVGALTITAIAPHRVEARGEDGERLDLPFER